MRAEVHSATRNIAQGVRAAAGGTIDVAENIERVAHGASETETTSGQMLRSAKALSEVSIHLKDEVEKFLDTVRAA
jgi:methyl-accepting chemotaxis protein